MTDDEGQFIVVETPGSLHVVFFFECQRLGRCGFLDFLDIISIGLYEWKRIGMYFIFHPFVVCGHVVCAVGDEEHSWG
jgi:hypothetical protein